MIRASALERTGGVLHAFFSRRGGVSEGLYASLNCGPGSGDDPARVAANRERAMDRLGLPGAALVTAHQTHSADVAVIDGAQRQAPAPKVDGLVTRTPGVALGVLSADCAPVLLGDPVNRVIAVAHAGWKGARGGILEAAVAAMTGLGARAGDTVAGIGPCIGRESYRVGGEFRHGFLEEDPANDAFFTARGGDDDKYLFDLAGYVARKLEGLGIGAIEALPLDTLGDEDRFFSYRRSLQRNEKDYGRCLSAIALT